MADLLVVVRSGTTDYDLQGRIRGNLDIPLSAAGLAAAAATARDLAAAPLVALYASPARCAAETAAVIGAALDITPRRVAGLANVDLGLWQGMLVKEIRRRQPRLARHWEDDPWSVVPPDGEALADARARVAVAIERILGRHSSGRVAVVVPQPLDRIIRLCVTGEAVGDLWEVLTGPSGVELPLREVPAPQFRAMPTGQGLSPRGLGGFLTAAQALTPFRGRVGLAEP